MQRADILLETIRRLLARVRVLLILGLLLCGIGVWMISLHRQGISWEIVGELGKFVALVLAIHLLDYQFLKREERVLFVGDLKQEVRSEVKGISTLLADMKSAFERARATVYTDREQIYSSIVDAFRRVNRENHSQKSLLLVGLHGDSGARRVVLAHKNPILRAFDDEMRNCIQSSGPEMWYVRELYNIADPSRLDMILRRIDEAGDAEGYEVRAYCVREPIPQFKPLVIGPEDLFLGLDDPTYYRVRAGLRITDRELVQLATEHFDEMWKDGRVFKLRTALGQDRAEIERLRMTIAALGNSDSCASQ